MKSNNAPLLSVYNYGLNISIGSQNWSNFIYHFVSSFHINTIEDYLKHSGGLEFPITPHRKEVYDFIFLTNGKVQRSKGVDEFTFSKNEFFFVPAYQITSMNSMSSDAKGFYCHFNAEKFYDIFFNEEQLHKFPFLHFTGNPIVKIDEQTTNFILPLLNKLIEEYKKDQACNITFIFTLLLNIFFSIQNFAKSVDMHYDNAAYKIANHYKQLLIKNIHQQSKVQFYANELSITPEYLNKCVKLAFGKSAKAYLDQMILLEAKVLLRQSTLSINEIAFKLGRENTSDFIRFFKLHTQITPSAYKKKI